MAILHPNLASEWASQEAKTFVEICVQGRVLASEKPKILFFNRSCQIVSKIKWTLILLCLSSFWACPANAQLQRFEFSHPQMGTLFQVIFYAKDSTTADFWQKKAFARLDELNLIFSDYEEHSEITRLANAAGRNAFLRLSDDLWKVLALSQDLAQQTEGAFDLSIGPLSKLWRKAFRQQQFPDSADLHVARPLCNFRNIELDRRHHAANLTKKGMRLDAGGIAKGYAVNVLFDLFKKAGFKNLLVIGGGDLRVGTPPPHKKNWTIASKVLGPDQQVIDGELHLKNTAISTSGDTYRFLEWNGQRYSHIIDPRTGLGLQHRMLFQIQGPSSTLCDGLATACSVLGKEKCEKVLKKHYPRYHLNVLLWSGNSE
jgi:FAD:protein FMN transferase